MAVILKAENVSVEFGGLKAVSGFDVEIQQGSLTGLIGPNGAGKTTVFNLLTGVYKPTRGKIYLNAKDITGKHPNQIAKAGMGRTFQNIRLFANLTVLENVMVAFNQNMNYTLLEGILRLPRYWKEERQAEAKALELLRVFDMDEMAGERAMNLPYGRQRKLEIARALATQPSLLLLDEPAAGMNPTETGELMNTIALIREKFNTTILLIEHDMSLVMGICEEIIVLDYGQIIAQGSPSEITSNKRVIEAYLGTDESAGEGTGE